MPDDVVNDDIPVDADLETDDDDDVDPDVDAPTADTDGDDDSEDEDAADDSEDDDDPAADDPDDSDDKGKATAKGRSAKLDKLLGKYGNDPDKMVDAYFEQANSMSRLAERVEALTTRLEAKQEDPEAEAKFVASDSEVKEYAGELASLDAEIKQAEKFQTGMVSEFGKLEKQIARLEGALEKAAIEDKQEVREQLAEARGSMKDLTRDWKDTQREIQRLNSAIRDTARRYRTAEATAKTRRTNELQREMDQVQAQHVTQREFLTSVQVEAAKYGLTPDKKSYQIVQQAVKERVVSVLRGLPKGSKPINLSDAVATLMEEYAEALELSKASKVSKQKHQVQAKTGPTGKPTGRPASPRLDPKSAEYWKQRARRISAGR